jgi:hypothetical protein
MIVLVLIILLLGLIVGPLRHPLFVVDNADDFVVFLEVDGGPEFAILLFDDGVLLQENHSVFFVMLLVAIGVLFVFEIIYFFGCKSRVTML